MRSALGLWHRSCDGAETRREGNPQRNFRQPDGKPRKGKVMIRKGDIDNFLIYTKSIEVAPTA